MLSEDLFHYTKASTALERILLEQKIKISQFEGTNDPREFKYLYINSFTGRLLNKSVDAFENKVRPILEKAKLKEWKVLCFSQHHPDLVSGKLSEVDNPHLLGSCLSSMWAHYASTIDKSHDGICLRFNRSRLESQIKGIFYDENRFVIHNGPVQYNNRMLYDLPPFNLDQLLELDEAGIVDAARKFFAENHKTIFFLKSEDWASENEYRWIVHSEKDDAEYVPIDGVLEDVYVGENFSRAYYPSVEVLCNKIGVEPKIIYWENGIPCAQLLKNKK